MDNTETINVLSLCTGYGGLELGLSRALEGVFRVVAVEIEAYALANLAAKAQEGKLAIEAMWPDLKTFEGEKFRGCFDIILAGYPCQPFSVAGKRKGTDDPRHLWPHIARIVEAVRPVWCIFENVPGHLTSGFPEVYCSLRDMGYTVEAGLFTAAEVGAPHKRQRLFILAHDTRAGLSLSNGQRTQATRPCHAKLECSGQLANTEATKRGRMSEEHAGRGIEETGRSGGGQLANTGSGPGGNQDGQTDGGSRQEDVPQGHGKAGTVRAGAAGQLADGDGTGCQEQRRAEPTRQKYTAPECCRWPARPGQPQYEWEEPRVVGDAGHIRAGKGGRSESKPADGLQDAGKQAESGVGRAVNGPSSRVDRLRLLGNGVVPQCAEKAIRELSKLF